MLQTSFEYTYENVAPGVEYGIGLHQIVSGFSSESIPFGRALVLDSTTPEINGRKNVLLPTDGTAKFAGISRLIHKEPSPTSPRNSLTTSGSEVVEYEPGYPISILEIGKIWVEVEEAVNVGDPVFVRFAAGAGGSDLGKFRNDADTSTARELPNAEWVTSTTGAGKAVVQIYK